jgi:SAM-dependent methyltransferase
MSGSSKSSWPITWVGRLHGAFVSTRRTQVLAGLLAQQVPQRASVLDIGCGDGSVASLIKQFRPDISVQGAEFLVRPDCKIPCVPYDGVKLPFPDRVFDVCLFVDVLHHTRDVTALLAEGCRVSNAHILLKDHLNENILDDATLRLMDWVGNKPHGVHLEYNYQSRKEWSDHFSKCGLKEVSWTSAVPLYPPPVSFIAGRSLHFVSLLQKSG